MKVYNTLSRRKEEFVPMDPREVKVYACGPTVYNYFHIGNARPFVVFDTLRRYLEYKGYPVKFVQNFTDVEDKIINRAREEGISASEVSEKYIREYFKDAEALHIRRASVHPKVTENIPDIIAFVEGLIEKGHAYVVDGDVYYSTRSFPGYGKLSGQNIDELEAGARVDVGDKKRDPLDFALWKAQKAGDELAWESPWGLGRPGWHIECSVMSRKYLGETIDIHGGGQDLIFPHHENEIAQSEAYSGKPQAHYWMHNGYITINNEKMSKSAGNFFTARDILQEYDGGVVRFFLLSGHYRSPINFSRELMEQAKAGMERIQNARGNLKHLAENGADAYSDAEREAFASLARYREKFDAAMDDDLNTADAISAIFELVRDCNSAVRDGASKGFAADCLALIDELCKVLGLLPDRESEEDGVPEDVLALVEERQQARKSKNFARADEIRDLLKERGFALEDTPQGIKIKRL